jgi:dienelactone hydrolase
MNTRHLFTLVIAIAVSFSACNDQKKENKSSTATADSSVLKEETVTFKQDTGTYKGYVVYDEKKQRKRPGILVLPEWWGMEDYAKGRAKQLAQLGYVAMAVDPYGNGKVAQNPQEAQSLAGPYYQNPQLAKQRIDAAIAELKTIAVTDTANIGAIGYCFGGYVVLNAAKLGSGLKAVVSFHGNLGGVSPNKDLLKAKVLVCQGGADQFVGENEQQAFRKSMDSIKANYQFIVYPDATHAFTNPASTEIGKKFNLPIKYNSAGDSASWRDMRKFFKESFGL